MRIRCPHHNCSLDLPNEVLGRSVRCTQCDGEFIVGAQHRDLTLDDCAASAFPFEEPTPIEHRLYDGLPPLSVMMAIRAGRPLDDRAAAAMTADDWKALSAFESVLWAVAHINSFLWLGGAAVGAHFLFFALSQYLGGFSREAPSPVELLGSFGFPVIAGTMLAALHIGRQALAEVHAKRWIARAVPWLSLLAGLAFAGVAIWLTRRLFEVQPGAVSCLDFFVLTGDVIAILPSFVACASSLAAIEKIAPPEIAKRLQDALAYLR